MWKNKGFQVLTQNSAVGYTGIDVGNCGKVWGKTTKLLKNMTEGFKGQYDHSMDRKRRVSIPAKMRNKLGDKVVVTKGVDGCLVLYPLPEWKRRAEHLQGLPTAKRETRALIRVILGSASEIELDKLGRVLIPEYLAEFANLEKEVSVIGIGNRIELWDKKRWDPYRKKQEQNMATLIEKIEELGI